MPNVILNGGHVVQEVTEALVDAAQLIARLQVLSPVKELLWLKIVRQFAIHAKVSPLSIIFRNLSSPFISKCKIIHRLANIPIEFSVAITMATTSKNSTEKTTETTTTEATTTPPPAPTTPPSTATESTTTASSEISTRTSTTKLTTSSAARGIQGHPCVGLIIAILLAPIVLYKK